MKYIEGKTLSTLLLYTLFHQVATKDPQQLLRICFTHCGGQTLRAKNMHQKPVIYWDRWFRPADTCCACFVCAWMKAVKHLNGGKLLCSALSIKVTTKANSQDMFHRLHTVLVRHWDQVNYASDNRSWDPIILTKQALNTLLLQGGISQPADMRSALLALSVPCLCFVCVFCLLDMYLVENRGKCNINVW